MIASSSGAPSSRSWLMNVTITSPFSTATPERAMKPTAAEIENGMPRSHRATMPPVSASGTPVNTSSAYLTELKVLNSSRKIRKKQSGTTTRQPLPRGDAGSRTARPSRASCPAGSFTCCVDPLLRLGDERADVAAADVGLHDDAPLAVLAADLVRALGDLDRRHRSERDEAGRSTSPRRAARPADANGCRRRSSCAAAGSAGSPARRGPARSVLGQAHDQSKRRSPSKTCPASRPPMAIATTSCTSATLRP